MAARASVRPKKQQQKAVPLAVPLEERIRQRAHEIYLQRGGRDGSELEDWLQAEAEMRQAEGQNYLSAAS